MSDRLADRACRLFQRLQLRDYVRFDFRADAARQKLDLSPASWRDLEKTVAEAFEATPKQIEIARKYYQ